jgi:hypothetical protein
MTMQQYKNLSGKSNVHAFEHLENGIIVQFNDHSQYTYQSMKVGTANLTEMQRLAECGQGLNSFISRTPIVRNGYSQKCRF